MNDVDLRARFAELRHEERGGVPSFALRPRRTPIARRVALAFAVCLMMILAVTAALRTHRRREQLFSKDDIAAARAIGAWRAPTDVLLRQGALR